MPDGAVNVYRPAAGATDEVVVVVIDPVLVTGRRARRLDTPDEAIAGQHAQGVVNRLTGDRSDVIADKLLDLVRRAVRPGCHRPQDGETLGRHLNTPLAEEVGGAGAYFPEHRG